VHDHYAITYTALRLAELHAEADRARLAASARAARAGRSWRGRIRGQLQRATTGTPTNVACCA
jgi:hypothetical protein